MAFVDLNCDLGESFGRYTLGLDDQVIPLITSANVACGMHAGDPVVMAQSVERCVAAGVAIGAHPGYPDLQGFGRRDMNLSAEEAYAFVLYQVSALAGFCQANGAKLHHVKPHGQLYNRAAKDEVLANAIARAVRDFDSDLVLVGLAGSCLIQAGRDLGLRTAGEFFADRNYQPDGSLVPRSQPNAVIANEDEAVARTVEAVKSGIVTASDGSQVAVDFDTICVHGDGPQALAFVNRIRAALSAAGVEIKAI